MIVLFCIEETVFLLKKKSINHKKRRKVAGISYTDTSTKVVDVNPVMCLLPGIAYKQISKVQNWSIAYPKWNNTSLTTP